jgi:hypothetical protein
LDKKIFIRIIKKICHIHINVNTKLNSLILKEKGCHDKFTPTLFTIRPAGLSKAIGFTRSNGFDVCTHEKRIRYDGDV